MGLSVYIICEKLEVDFFKKINLDELLCCNQYILGSGCSYLHRYCIGYKASLGLTKNGLVSHAMGSTPIELRRLPFLFQKRKIL